MNRPPISVLRAVLRFGGRPLQALVDEEYAQPGSSWVINSGDDSCPCMILALRGHRGDAANDMAPVVEELKHFKEATPKATPKSARGKSRIEIFNPHHANLRSEVIYYVDATIGRTKKHTVITDRRFKIHPTDDPIWAHMSLAWLSIPWYTPGMTTKEDAEDDPVLT